MAHKPSHSTVYLPVSFLTVLSLLCLDSAVAGGQQTVFQSQPGNQSGQQETGQQGIFPAATSHPSYPSPLQKGLWKGHPQVLQILQVSRPPVALPAAPQPEPKVQQSLLELDPHKVSLESRQNGSVSSLPIALGLVAKSVWFCQAGRYMTGVRVAGLEKGSPAQRAGLQADKGLGWKQVVGMFLASTPAAPLMMSFLESAEQGSGDTIVAIDGKPVRNKEAFERRVKHFRAEQVVSFSVLRGGRTVVVPVRLPSGRSVR